MAKILGKHLRVQPLGPLGQCIPLSVQLRTPSMSFPVIGQPQTGPSMGSNIIRRYHATHIIVLSCKLDLFRTHFSDQSKAQCLNFCQRVPRAKAEDVPVRAQLSCFPKHEFNGPQFKNSLMVDWVSNRGCRKRKQIPIPFGFLVGKVE